MAGSFATNRADDVDMKPSENETPLDRDFFIFLDLFLSVKVLDRIPILIKSAAKQTEVEETIITTDSAPTSHITPDKTVGSNLRNNPDKRISSGLQSLQRKFIPLAMINRTIDAIAQDRQIEVHWDSLL